MNSFARVARIALRFRKTVIASILYVVWHRLPVGC